MHSGQPDQSTPFLDRSFSPEHDSMSDDKNALVAGKPQASRRGSGRKFVLRGFLSKLLGWPAIVIAGQLILQLAAWTFFAVVQLKESIPLPAPAAAWVEGNVHTVIASFNASNLYLYTNIHDSGGLFFPASLPSSGLFHTHSYASSFFSWGVRQSIALHLHGDGMSLAHLVSNVKLSSRSLIFDRRKRKWSTLSIVLILLTGVQAAGWSSLLTPLVIFMDTPITGYEIDLTNPSLRALPTDRVYECVVNSPNLPAFVVGMSESGSAAVKADLGFPASLTVMDQTFNNATAGILPLYFEDINASPWFPNIPTILTTIEAEEGLPDGLSSTFTMTQQGFTANVNCAFQQLSANTTPSITSQIYNVKDWDDDLWLGNISYYSLSSNCPNDERFAANLNSSDVYISLDVPNPSTLLMVAGGSADGYTLIFHSSEVTNTAVTYNKRVNVTTSANGAVSDAGGPASFSAVTTIYNMVRFAQATYSNVMGDQLEALVNAAPSQFTDDNILGVMENYLHGVTESVFALKAFNQGEHWTEYSGSVLRACLSGVNSTFQDGVPLSLSTPVTGKVSTQTIGWMHISAITPIGLIPGTLVGILTICIVVVAIAQHARDAERDPFDVSDPMYLITAAAAGGSNTGQTLYHEGERVIIGERSETAKPPRYARRVYVTNALWTGVWLGET
ncbi:hypothetical protein B0H16DRAFT_1758791 [Mycena metata]|uniref:Uncharacterized protein n=1 Tax=Mycena metata TaxID=1033252 RepID=A0AAD7IDS0_9AGAR|nr:hypothetical protein B0H16DRAFT_1758791 [Mycena metata]